MGEPDDDLVDPAIWPTLMEWLRSLPEAPEDDMDDPEPFI